MYLPLIYYTACSDLNAPITTMIELVLFLVMGLGIFIIWGIVLQVLYFFITQSYLHYTVSTQPPAAPTTLSTDLVLAPYMRCDVGIA